MELSQSTIQTYVETICSKSAHKYTATSAECAAMTAQVGRPVSKMVNVSFQAPFATRNTLGLLLVTYDDGDIEALINYNDDLVCRYRKSSYTVEFDVCKTYDSDWQVDLELLYQASIRGL